MTHARAIETDTSRRESPALAALRRRIRAIETGAAGEGAETNPAVPLGAAGIDGHLPWGGLPRAMLHEVVADDAGAGIGFAVMLAARLVAERPGAAVLWCVRRPVLDAGHPYSPGLAAAGLDPARLVVARARNDAAALWVMEEGLRAGGATVAAVLGEVGQVSLTESRRLALAAEAGGGTAILLRPGGDRAAAAASAAATRWRLAAWPGGGIARSGAPWRQRWQADLFRCRGGVPGEWLMEWQDETGGFAVAAAPGDRQDCQARRREAR